MPKKVLGKGLGALLSYSDSENGSKESDILQISISNIEPNAFQPRKSFNSEKLQELAESIKEKGLIQPIIVTKHHDKYEIIVGERRWRACQMAGLKAIPAILKEASSYEKLEIALIENIQRQDLNSIEEANSYKELLENLNLTQEQLSVKIGKSRAAIANTVRLLKLPEIVQQSITHELLTEGHGRALLALKNEKDILKVKDYVERENLSVRQTEKYVQQINNGLVQEVKANEVDDSFINGITNIQPNLTSEETPKAEPEIQEIENQLNNYFNLKVNVKKHPTKYKGKIEIKYQNHNELNGILKQLGLK